MPQGPRQDPRAAGRVTPAKPDSMTMVWAARTDAGAGRGAQLRPKRHKKLQGCIAALGATRRGNAAADQIEILSARVTTGGVP